MKKSSEGAAIHQGSARKEDTEEIQTILDLDLEISGITKGVLDHELRSTNKTTLKGNFLVWHTSRWTQNSTSSWTRLSWVPDERAWQRRKEPPLRVWERARQPERVSTHTAGENAELDDRMFDSIPATFLLWKLKLGPTPSYSSNPHFPCGDY